MRGQEGAAIFRQPSPHLPVSPHLPFSERDFRNFGDKAITFFRHGFDKLVAVFVFAQNFSQGVNASRDIYFFDKRICPDEFSNSSFSTRCPLRSTNSDQHIENFRRERNIFAVMQ